VDFVFGLAQIICIAGLVYGAYLSIVGVHREASNIPGPVEPEVAAPPALSKRAA